MSKPALKFLIAVFLCFFALAACSPQGIPPAPAVQAGDFAPGQLEAHFAKHGYQFGNITQQQYLDDARALLDAPLNNDVLGKMRPDGDILRYRASTGEFAVMTSEGRIRTYFKTDYNYWLRQ